jgi:predicted RNA-binding Zn-ribbon protein involved in translation (DUF1610 family)
MARRSGYSKRLTDTVQHNWDRVLTFECPKCGNDRLHEELCAPISLQITGLDTEKGTLVEGLHVDTREGNFFGYRCSECGQWLKNADGTNVRCERELVTYLENQSGNYHIKAEEYRNHLLMTHMRSRCLRCKQPCNDYLSTVRGRHTGLTH